MSAQKRRPYLIGFFFSLSALLWSLPSYTARAGDWPQMLGPHRNGHADRETLAGSWSDARPRPLWRYEAGQGYAGPVVQGERVLLFHRLGSEEVLTCLSASSGLRQWETRWPTTYAGGVDADQGPRCAPLIDGEDVFVYGAAGNLHCVSLTNGDKRWSRRLARDFDASDGYFGAGSGPLVAAGLVVLNVGGRRREAGIVAVDRGSGETRWTTLADDGSYSAPILSVQPANPLAVFVTRLHLIGLQPQTGQILFQMPFGKSGPTVNAATPLWVDDNEVFVTASYGIGAKLVTVDENVPRIKWQSDDVLSSQYPTPVLVGQQLFGVHGREDGPPAEFRCVDVQSGKVRWKRTEFGMAHVILADGKLLVQQTEGDLLLLDPDASEYRELARISLTKSTARALPALAQGQYYVRDIRGQLTAWKLP